MNYVVFRKDRLRTVEALLRSRGDEEAAQMVNDLLQSELSDNYLAAIESMVPFTQDDLDFWENRLGLIRNKGYESIDFFIPDIEVPICEWLEFSVLREKVGSGCNLGPIIWDGYRFVGDKSLTVCLGKSKNTPKRSPEKFPRVGGKINMSNYDHINWEFAKEQGLKLPSWLGKDN